MIPDATGVYREPGLPRVYDPQLEAYRDTTGRIWNPALGAWQDVWGHKPLYLYDNGVCHGFEDVHTYGIITRPENTWVDEMCGKISTVAVDVTRYKKLCSESGEHSDYSALLICADRSNILYHDAYLHTEQSGTHAELDISAARGYYYVFAGAARSKDRYMNVLATINGDTGYRITTKDNSEVARFDRVWLE